MDEDHDLEKGLFTFYRQQLQFQSALQRGDHIDQTKSIIEKPKILKRYQLKRNKSKKTNEEQNIQQNSIAPIRLYRFEKKYQNDYPIQQRYVNKVEQRRMTFSLLNKKKQKEKHNHHSQLQIQEKQEQSSSSVLGSYLQNKQFPFFQQLDNQIRLKFESEDPLTYQASLQVMRQIQNQKNQKNLRSQSKIMKYHSHEKKIKPNAKSMQIDEASKLPLIEMAYKKAQNRYVVKHIKNKKKEQKLKPQPLMKIRASFEKKGEAQVGVTQVFKNQVKKDYQSRKNQRKKLIQMLKKFKQNL